MSEFRSLTSQYRLQGFSLPEIVGNLEQESIRLSRSLSVNGRRLKPGPLINAVILEFLAMPSDSRVALAARGLAKLEALMASGGPPLNQEGAAGDKAPTTPEDQ